MRKGGGKQKGASFERDVAKKLSLWLSAGEREDCLWRSAMSGGRATVARKGGKNLESQAGDLSAVNETGQPFINNFYVELKNYKNLQVEAIWSGKGNLLKFWQTTVEEANCYRKLPMLIAKQNQYPACVYLQRQGMIRLGLNDANTIINSWRYGLFGVLLDDFIQQARPF